MSMVRMFHISCDNLDCRGTNDLGDEWYSSAAIAVAKESGFHIRGDRAICEECWEEGTLFADLIV